MYTGVILAYLSFIDVMEKYLNMLLRFSCKEDLYYAVLLKGHTGKKPEDLPFYKKYTNSISTLYREIISLFITAKAVKSMRDEFFSLNKEH